MVPGLRLDRSGPVVLSAIAVLGAVVGVAFMGYVLYEVVANPPKGQNPGIRYIDRFQFLGAVSFLVPVAAATGFLVVATVLLLRYRAEVAEGPHSRPLSPAARRWVARAASATAGGYVPAVVVVSVVAVADQLFGSPRTASTVAGGAVGFLAFGGAWVSARRLLKSPLLPRLPQAVLVSGLVAALLSALALTRTQDEQNLVLWDKAPIAAGFHDVSAEAVPSVSVMFVTCANTSDCVATGSGTYYGPNPWASWALLGTSTDGGADWRVAVLPSSVAVTTKPTCSGSACRLALLPADDHVRTNGPPVPVTVTFNSDGGAQISEAKSERWPFGAVPPVCTGSRCLIFGASRSGMAAWYSDNGGATWASTTFPTSRRSSQTVPAGPGQGPWCTTPLDCTGAGVVESDACGDLGNTRGCTWQLIMWQTADGGRTWSAKTFPVDRPPVANVECGPGGICTGLFPGDGAASASSSPLTGASAGRLPGTCLWVRSSSIAGA